MFNNINIIHTNTNVDFIIYIIISNLYFHTLLQDHCKYIYVFHIHNMKTNYYNKNMCNLIVLIF